MCYNLQLYNSEEIKELKQDIKEIKKTLHEMMNILLYAPPKQGTEVSRLQQQFEINKKVQQNNNVVTNNK